MISRRRTSLPNPLSKLTLLDNSLLYLKLLCFLPSYHPTFFFFLQQELPTNMVPRSGSFYRQRLECSFRNLFSWVFQFPFFDSDRAQLTYYWTPLGYNTFRTHHPRTFFPFKRSGRRGEHPSYRCIFYSYRCIFYNLFEVNWLLAFYFLVLDWPGCQI